MAGGGQHLDLTRENGIRSDKTYDPYGKCGVGSMQPNWQRLRRGLRALFKGSRETNKDGERLHEFVRAVEALIKPRIGRSKADFVHRAQTFAMASPDTMKALGDIYEIRNCVEHLNSPLDAVTGTEEQRIERVNWRTRQADCLSRFALAHILESNDLLEIFMTDSNIDDFWSKQDHERGPPLGYWTLG